MLRFVARRLPSCSVGRQIAYGCVRHFVAEPAPVEDDTLRHSLNSQLSDIKAAGTFKSEFEITSAQGPEICKGMAFAGTNAINLSSIGLKLYVLCAAVDGVEGPVLNFCSNNYLGLSNHPRLIQAAHEALDTHGFGLSSVRFICGTQVGCPTIRHDS